MLSRMRMNGIDANGRPWPPPLDPELCESIGYGRDLNKECKCYKDILMIEVSNGCAILSTGLSFSSHFVCDAFSSYY